MALLVLVVVLGATMQGLVGLGLNLVSAPVVTMVAPSLMPELLLALAVLLPFFTLARSHAGIDWRGLAWVLPARVPGVALGVLFLALFSDRAVAIAVAVSDPELALAGALVYALAYTLELALALVLYFGARPVR